MDREEQVLAEALNEYRIKNKLSYQDIANHIGMSRYTVRDYMNETNHSNLSLGLQRAFLLNENIKGG